MRKFYITLLALIFIGAQQSFGQAKQSIRNAQHILDARNLNIQPAPNQILPSAHDPQELMPNGFVRDRCGFTYEMNKLVAAGYNPAQFEAVIQAKIAEIEANRVAGRTTTAVNYIIPVVFHVIHSGTAVGTGDNITAAQIYQQIDQLNKDFHNLSGSPHPAAASTQLTFCPVLQDPLGNTLAEPGVERINYVTKGWTDPLTFTSIATAGPYINGTIKPASIWDPSKYVNIWTYNILNTGILGFSTLPTAGPPDLPIAESATTAGVVYLPGAIGSVISPGPSSLSPYNLGRTVTHELGHFFGLYHPWGTATDCSGTDYCADVPTCSDEYYSAVPACPAPTQCGGRRMVENFMDYSDDGCLNTFTQNQVDRIQSVMLLAPRRPKNPPATMCTPAVANALSFTSATTNTIETGTTGTCPKYTDYVVSVAPSINATGNATVNFTFGGTAILNNDYLIIGSTSVSYTNGDGSAKSITVRVFDDGAVEPTETIIIGYTITGTGLIAGTTNTTHTITILDDDALSQIDNINPIATLYSENFGTTANGGILPTGWIKGSFLSPTGANVFTVNGLYGSATGFTTAANGRVLHITNGNAAAQTAETAAALYSATSESDYVTMMSPVVTTGYRNIKLNFDYACVGEEDANGVYDVGILRYSNTAQSSGLRPVLDGTTGQIMFFKGKTAKTAAVVSLPDSAVANRANIWMGFEWINDNTVAGSPNVPFIIDNVVVTGEKLGVETNLNESSNQTQMNGQTVQYVSSNNRIIAQISNLNANVGCISATVQQAGVNKIGLEYTSASGTSNAYRTEKVIKITPSVPNGTATYALTLYFTTDELNAWGAEVNSLKILKVKEGTDIYSVLNLSNTTIFPTTVDDQRTTKGYVAFSANVTGGFSQFMLSQPIIIPVNLLSFEARPNRKNILLNFATATETNNKGFVIERSTDGTNFKNIGWVNGQGTTNLETRYTYTDNFVQPEVLYYYRLRQTDFDGHEKLSEIRSAKIKGSGVIVTVSPNPATDQIKLFIAGTNGKADVQLINAAGQVVRKWGSVSTLNGVTTLDVSALSSGMYSIMIVTPEETSIQKLIIRN